MKKRVIFVVGVFAVALFVTGCSSKKSTLTCTQTSSGVDITFNVGFQGVSIDSMDFDYDMDLSEYTDDQVDAIGEQDFCSAVKDAMSDYKDAFTDCKQDITNKHLKVSSSLDVDKVATNVLDKMTSPESAKESLESQGYECTIK